MFLLKTFFASLSFNFCFSFSLLSLLPFTSLRKSNSAILLDFGTVEVQDQLCELNVVNAETDSLVFFWIPGMKLSVPYHHKRGCYLEGSIDIADEF